MTLPKTTSFIEQGIELGHHVGAQVHVRVSGEVVADIAIGESRPGVSMGHDTVSPIYCSAKPILAVGLAVLVSEGLLSFDDPVAAYIEAFSSSGPTPISLRHVLTHTTGFRFDPCDPFVFEDWQAAIDAAVSASHGERDEPGTRARYQGCTFWYIVGEAIMRASGQALPDHLNGAVLRPLGIEDIWFRFDAELARSADPAKVGLVYVTEERQHPEPLFLLEDEQDLQFGPLAVRGSMRALGAFYQGILDMSVAELIGEELSESLCHRWRSGLRDDSFGAIVDWGLGFALETRIPGHNASVFGRFTGDDSFGHHGRRSSFAFADPRTLTVVAVQLNGMPSQMTSHFRSRRVTDAIYRDLGLTQ